jgi:hypothetical protein
MRPGGGSRIFGPGQAVQRAAQQRTARQVPRSRVIQPVAAVTELVHEIVTTPATVAEFQSLAVVFQAAAAEADAFEPERLAEGLHENPYVWLLRTLPENKAEAYNYVQMIFAILSFVATVVFGVAVVELGQAAAPDQQPPVQQQAPVVVTPEQEQQIVQQIRDEIADEDASPASGD